MTSTWYAPDSANTATALVSGVIMALMVLLVVFGPMLLPWEADFTDWDNPEDEIEEAPEDYYDDEPDEEYEVSVSDGITDLAGRPLPVGLSIKFTTGTWAVPGTGVLLNNGVMWFDPRPGTPNAIAPGNTVTAMTAVRRCAAHRDVCVETLYLGAITHFVGTRGNDGFTGRQAVGNVVLIANRAVSAYQDLEVQGLDIPHLVHPLIHVSTREIPVVHGSR